VKDLLTQFSQATTRDAQMALIDPFLDAWADTAGMSETLDDRNPSAFVVRYDRFGAMTRAQGAAPDPITGGPDDVRTHHRHRPHPRPRSRCRSTPRVRDRVQRVAAARHAASARFRQASDFLSVPIYFD
jgi:hypothetical protein